MVAGSGCRSRRGVTRGDVIVLVILLGVTGLLALMGMSRAREGARLNRCARNLAQMGFALALHDQMKGQLPEIASTLPPGEPTSRGTSSPLRGLLQSLDLPDLSSLHDPKTRPKGGGPVPGEIPIPGFVCSSDPNALSGRLPAPISYRAATGDSPLGRNGAFAIGRHWSLAAVEARDGLSYTAAFSERLVGSAEDGPERLPSYRISASSVGDSCPTLADALALREDAGSSWIAADYRSTLYNHAQTPGARPSCIARDGASARIGASSGHVRGVNLLRLDGSVSLTLPTIAPAIWRDLAAIRDPQP